MNRILWWFQIYKFNQIWSYPSKVTSLGKFALFWKIGETPTKSHIIITIAFSVSENPAGEVSSSYLQKCGISYFLLNFPPPLNFFTKSTDHNFEITILFSIVKEPNDNFFGDDLLPHNPRGSGCKLWNLTIVYV